MKLEKQTFADVIHKSYFKQSLKRADIELFKTNLNQLFSRIDATESEEHNKNIVSDFLKNTYYKNRCEINTSGRKDLAIHKGKTNQTPVSIIIETKSPANKAEMISHEKPNAKALHELVHYYMNERLIKNNTEIKHLIVTNIYEWFIFDATVFENFFYACKSFRNQYLQWTNKELAGTTTDWFYSEIAKPYIDNELDNLQCAYLDLQSFQNLESLEDAKLINLYKIFSPEHLLKLPFANDYNKIDTGFYNELLHIMGLEETKKAGKKLITRIKEKNRKSGSLLENAITVLSERKRLKHIERLDTFGETEDEQLFSIALELVITWLNRILFLKLLEAQLIKFHRGDVNYALLNIEKIKDFDELDELFFEVLAKKTGERSPSVNEKYGNLPYLNSSLFEISKLEDSVLFIAHLKDRLKLDLSAQTVLKDKQGKKRTGQLNTLEYLFEFLNAYSFASIDKAEIQDDSRTIINAAVLGLIFEKINGYKDGSFYTPSFITTYISREIVRKTVVKKFSEIYTRPFKTFEHLKGFIDYADNDERKKANAIVDSIKICDPAVGSGHFLVSVLNELVAVKSELKILTDTEGNRLRGIKIENVNDELEIIDEETSEAFQYYVNDKGIPPSEIQNTQQTIFNEKRNLIENCIYGVDINQKSVLICRLRLWIELLKHTYYRPVKTRHGISHQLETLPNIDINIKTGNSLVSKFDTALNIFEQKAVNNLVATYKINTHEYKNTTDYDKKTEYRNQIKRIKSELEKYAVPRDKYYRKYLKSKEALNKLLNIESTNKDVVRQISELSEEVANLEKKYKENYYNVYANSMEWALEFPEVLSSEGRFLGFDVIIGNPPYFSISKDQNLKEVNENYTVFKNTADIYTLFVERGIQVLKANGILSYITSNKWLRAAYGENLRTYLLKNVTIDKIIDFDGLKVFDEATVDTGIIEITKQKIENQDVEAVRLDKTFNLEKDSISKYFENHKIRLTKLNSDSWNLKSGKENAIKTKIERKGTPLKNWDINIFRGITTGLNEAFVIDTETKNKLINEDKKNADLIKPLLRGRDIKRYYVTFNDLWVVCVFPSQNIDIENYKSIKNYLNQYRKKLESKPKNHKGNWTGRKSGDFEWFEIQDNTAYYPEFEKEKIIFTKASQTKSFAYDKNGFYLQNTSYILTGENLKYLIALLNSKLFTFAFLNFYQSGGIEGEITVQAMNKLPIPEITGENQKTIKKIENLVNQIIDLKSDMSNTNIDKQTKAIDKLVYKIYHLTTEEIQIIENATT